MINAGDASSRVSLQFFSLEDARRVLRGQKKLGQSLGREYPSQNEADVLRAMVHEPVSPSIAGPFGQYQVELTESSMVIGGAGFLGPPDEFGAVQIDLQIVPDHLGRGYEAETVAQLIGLARQHHARFVIATTNVGERIAQETLIAGGLYELTRDETIVHFALDLDAA
jgi:GNAT superfamily N-acetyltransferase